MNVVSTNSKPSSMKLAETGNKFDVFVYIVSKEMKTMIEIGSHTEIGLLAVQESEWRRVHVGAGRDLGSAGQRSVRGLEVCQRRRRGEETDKHVCGDVPPCKVGEDAKTEGSRLCTSRQLADAPRKPLPTLLGVAGA